MTSVEELKVKIFADGADLDGIRSLCADARIKGVTTNPTLMRQAGIDDYAGFAREVLAIVPDRPVSFEVFADDFGEMESQAREIATWGPNVNVKIPVTNTSGEFSGPLIGRLAASGVKLNITAILSMDQVKEVAKCLSPETPAIVSVFAGRIADTGRDPVPFMVEALRALESKQQAELLWASPRELYNIFQADSIGCHIITAGHGILKKLALVGKDLDEYSLETVEMFYHDAQAAGYNIATR